MATITLPKPFAEIHAEAIKAAREAATKFFKERLNGVDQYACGFAWVKIPNVKLSTKVGKEIAKSGFSKSYTGGVELWNPSGMSVQNIDVKEAGADAYAAVLRSYGINAYAQSRLD